MKTGKYTARIEARRAELLAMNETGNVKPTPDYSALFNDNKEVKKAIENRVEQEILDRFGGYDSMAAMFDAELSGEKSMTVAETIAHLRAIAGSQK